MSRADVVAGIAQARADGWLRLGDDYSSTPATVTEPSTPESVPAPTAALDLEQRAARFAQVEVRPQQSAFRNAVFRACGGKCVVGGSSVPEALEAAHKEGRDWREGHNAAEDGILLRRDLYTLYDRGLLRISDAGTVAIDPSVSGYY